MRISRRFFIVLLSVFLISCNRQAHSAPYINFSQLESNGASEPTADPYLPPTRAADQPLLTPTPSPPKPLPTLRTEDIYYTVGRGDSIQEIAEMYHMRPEDIIESNDIQDPSIIYTGQRLFLPAPKTSETGPGYKMIPDSELVNGPYTVRFQIEAFVNNQPGFLRSYVGEIDGVEMSGAEIVQRVSDDYSVNPRMLLAFIEYETGWLTGQEDTDNPYPLGHRKFGYEGLYYQLAWAADELNRGYYLWKVRGVGHWLCEDGIHVPINPTINAGTAGLQHLLSHSLPYDAWLAAVTEGGFVSTYSTLFGYPFDYNFSPLIPLNLEQPILQLPFEDGVPWLFTGGPHGGWDDGSAWAALDFAPGSKDLGCGSSNDWVVAVADGPIVRSDNGAVVQSIDGDPYGQTGWSILYMHIETKDRVEVGTRLQAGDRIGHPSCEGGISTGTHLHIARRYNGEWIPADQDLPFVMDGWVSQGLGYPYQGLLIHGNQSIQAEETKTEFNRIQR